MDKKITTSGINSAAGVGPAGHTPQPYSRVEENSVENALQQVGSNLHQTRQSLTHERGQWPTRSRICRSR